MYEAQLSSGALWKRVIEAIKDLVNEANLDCSPWGTQIQAMDPAHVALVNLLLKKGGFTSYSCERSSVLGINLTALSKILKTTENSDSITFRHEDDSDTLTIVADSDDGERVSEFHLKLMEIETESLGIPDLDYKATFSMSSAEFAKIVRDLAVFNDTVTIEVKRDGVRFSTAGDLAAGSVSLKATSGAFHVTKKKAATKKEKAHDAKKEDADVKAENSTENEPGHVKQEKAEDNEDDQPISNLLHKKTEQATESAGVSITSMNEPVNLSFALRYLNTFAKGSSLSDRVTLKLARESPCMVEFGLEGNLGYLRYYLAPKVDDGAQ